MLLLLLVCCIHRPEMCKYHVVRLAQMQCTQRGFVVVILKMEKQIIDGRRKKNNAVTHTNSNSSHSIHIALKTNTQQSCETMAHKIKKKQSETATCCSVDNQIMNQVLRSCTSQQCGEHKVNARKKNRSTKKKGKKFIKTSPVQRWTNHCIFVLFYCFISIGRLLQYHIGNTVDTIKILRFGQNAYQIA